MPKRSFYTALPIIVVTDCDCGSGTMASTGEVAMAAAAAGGVQYHHRCMTCSAEAWFDRTYPRQEWVADGIKGDLGPEPIEAMVTGATVIGRHK